MKRPLCIAGVCLGAGALFGAKADAFWVLFVALACFLLLVLHAVVVCFTGQGKSLFLVCLFTGVFVFGAASSMGMLMRGTLPLRPLSGQLVTAHGQVTRLAPDGKWYDLKLQWIDDQNNQLNAPSKVRVYPRQAERIDIMDTVTVQGNLRLYRRPRYPADSDMAAHYASMGVFGSVLATSQTVEDRTASPFHPTVLLHRLRTALSGRIDDLFSGQQAALLKGLLLGDTADFSDDLREAMSLSGLSHIAAVSGMNISIVLSVLGTLLAFRGRRSVRGFVFTALGVFAYLLLVGPQPPVMRAGLMVLFANLFSAMGWRRDTLSALMASGAVLLLINPYYICSVSFQLSFLATLGIVVYGRHFPQRSVMGVFGMTLASFLLLSPLIGYYFNVVAYATFFANVLVSPLMVLLLPLGYLTCLLPFVSPLVDVLLRLVIWVAEVFAKMDFLAVRVSSLGILFFLFYGGLLVLLYTILVKHRRRLLWQSIAACIVCVSLVFGALMAPPNTTVTLLNLHQDRIAHVRTAEGRNIFVDVGSSQTASESNVLSYCQKRGIRRIDLIVITQNRTDHFGGVASLLQNGVQVDQIYAPWQVQQGKSNAHQLFLQSVEQSDVLYYNGKGIVAASGAHVSLSDNTLQCFGTVVSLNADETANGSVQYVIGANGLKRVRRIGKP